MDTHRWLEDGPADQREVWRTGLRDLLAEVFASDGVPALSEAFVRGIDEGSGHRHLLALDDGRVVGVLAVDAKEMDDAAAIAELAVHPAVRRRGIATALLREAATGIDPNSQFSVWSHGDLGAARGLAQGRGARTVRELLKMTVPCGVGDPVRDTLLTAVASARTTVEAADLEILDYTAACAEFGGDVVDEEWLRVNNEAFAWHPEQGGWDLDRLRGARTTDWFDPAGVIMLWYRDEVQGPHCAGVHWTKHPAGDTHGEVYVVCLADAVRGRGLGGPLTLLGIGHLIDGGAEAVDLYVEGDNTPAVATYRRLGFEVVHRDVVYRGMV
ncbi:mycothiol synthase [Corynebacterium terpenotabidum]|uniref:Mycothiol acetyltransferase n=1 Tax=Corynebacterium terpenotabidum Y-11 TaxID=1200352 RepID=S4XCE9_9CORY|nr:mycothiol synthase [Corynebacterium terpenotabidum]AGP30174.1 MshD acetyltransferase [Corynebacterium terpenotabidum Y-11]